MAPNNAETVSEPVLRNLRLWIPGSSLTLGPGMTIQKYRSQI
jgi:hypothetical protein